MYCKEKKNVLHNEKIIGTSRVINDNNNSNKWVYRKYIFIHNVSYSICPVGIIHDELVHIFAIWTIIKISVNRLISLHFSFLLISIQIKQKKKQLWDTILFNLRLKFLWCHLFSVNPNQRGMPAHSKCGACWIIKSFTVGFLNPMHQCPNAPPKKNTVKNGTFPIEILSEDLTCLLGYPSVTGSKKAKR